MRVREISVSLGRKINMGHYESGEVKAFVSIELTGDEPVAEAYEIAYRMVGNAISKQMAELKKSR